MCTLTSRSSRLFVSIFFMVFAAAFVGARAESQPLKVAIVGLEHGHVEGFLSQLPKHSDVQLVGIADADTSLWQKYGKKYGLADTLFYKITGVDPGYLSRITPFRRLRASELVAESLTRSRRSLQRGSLQLFRPIGRRA